MRNARHQRIVRVRVGRVLRERVRGPGERSVAASCSAPEAPPNEPRGRAGTAGRRRIEVKCAAGERVPLAAPAKIAYPGRYAVRAPGRMCRPAGSPTRSGRSSGCARGSRRPHPKDRMPSRLPSIGKLPPRRLAVHDPLGADDARVADVDHVRRLDVEADAKAREEETGCGEQDPGRPHRPGRGDPRPGDADVDAARDHPDQRAGSKSGTAVKTSPWLKNQSEAVGDNSITEVEVSHGERSAEVGEPEEENETETSPEPGVVDLHAAECTRGSRGPSSTRPAARSPTRWGAACVVDLAFGDLAGLAPPDLHRPGAHLPVVVLLVRAVRRRGAC